MRQVRRVPTRSCARRVRAVAPYASALAFARAHLNLDCGCRAYGTAGKLEKWYNPIWHSEAYVPSAAQAVQLKALRTALEAAVDRQLMTDVSVPYGVLLSGVCSLSHLSVLSPHRDFISLTLAFDFKGLDSSLISAIAVRQAQKRLAENLDSKTGPTPHSIALITNTSSFRV
jgi:hypothetical protein